MSSVKTVKTEFTPPQTPAELARPLDTEASVTTGPIDTFTVETLRNTLGEMQELYEKNRRGELQVKDESLLVELEFHIDQLADTLQALETEIKNKA